MRGRIRPRASAAADGSSQALKNAIRVHSHADGISVTDRKGRGLTWLLPHEADTRVDGVDVDIAGTRWSYSLTRYGIKAETVVAKPRDAREETTFAPCGCPEGIGRFRSTYVRRESERTVLHTVVRDHLETFLAEARVRGGGDGVPGFVERELREYLSCGVMARGFARFRCSGCRREILVAFSCKGRGFCPSCCGRRMCVLAAHLVDGVLGDLPVRQWVLTLPFRHVRRSLGAGGLRYVLAFDHDPCRKVLAVFVRALLAFERRRAAARGVVGRGGAITAIQRCGLVRRSLGEGASALNTNIHFHTLVAEGVFVEFWGGTSASR